MEKEKFENDVDVELKAVGAYCISEDKDARFPKENFQSVVPKEIAEDEPDILVLESGNIEITNLKVNEAMLDTKKDINTYKKEWFEKTEKNSEDLFNVAEEATKKHPNLKVVIVKRLPRYDRSSTDLLNIKSNLSQFGNSVYDQVWLKRGSPSNIKIVELNLGCKESPHLRKIIYGDQKHNAYVGYHLRGDFASRHFTYWAI